MGTIIDPSVPRALSEIIGGLLGAIIDAQAQSARATIDFVEEFGTKEGSVDSTVIHELRNISFNYTKKNENGETSQYTLELPLLSMVEIPTINIKSAKFSFIYDVVETNLKEVTEKTSSVTPVKGGVQLQSVRKWIGIPKPITIVGKVSKDSYSKSSSEVNAGIKIDFELEKSSLPLGLDRILDMLEVSSTDKALKKNEK